MNDSSGRDPRKDAVSTPQWQLACMRMVNWGGFDGYHRADFALAEKDALGTTMITGGSGTGKSTLLDAYIEIMMPANTRFNSASNDVGKGRARGEQERSVLTYLQGKTDVVYDDELGAERDQVLRDGSCARWSAIVATFAHGNGSRFSAAKFFYLRPGCSGNDGYKVHLVTADGALDPRRLESIAKKPFDKKGIRGLYEGIAIHDSLGAYHQRIHTTLNIGSHGDGSNATELLARIQSGYNITTVDGLFKELVLDKPRTFEQAERAVRHFDDIESTYEEIEDARSKMDVLSSIVEDKRLYDEAQGEADLVASMGSKDDPTSPFHRWRIRRESAELEEAVARFEAEKAGSVKQLNDMTCEVGRLDEEIAVVDQELHKNGDDAVRALTVRIEQLGRERERRLGNKALFEDKVSLYAPTPKTQESYDQLASTASAFLASFDEVQKELQSNRDDRYVERRNLEQRIGALRQEEDYLQKHKGNIPRHLNEAREEIASVVGLSLDDLPFVGELIDIKPEDERWRLAAETTLHGLARTMLVDKDQLDRVSRLIDSLKLRTRIHFQGVKPSEAEDVRMKPGGIASKLDYDDRSRFTPWVRKRVAASGIDALCVESPAQLRGDELRVTVTGQTRFKNRGAHGRNPSDRGVIGFDNRRRLEEVRAQVREAVEAHVQMSEEVKRAEASLGELLGKQAAFSYVSDHSFEEIDAMSVSNEIVGLRADKERLLRSNDILRDLRRKRKGLGDQREQVANKRAVLADRMERMEDRARSWAERKQTCELEEKSFEERGLAALREDQHQLLDRLAERASVRFDDAGTLLLRFDSFALGIWNDANAQQQAAESAAKTRKASLERAFRMYQSRWSDNDLGTSIDSYEDYREILEAVQAEGLHDRMDEWLENMRQWVAEDLVPLSNAYELAIREIEDRLDPINAILGGFLFGSAQGRLVMEMRQKTSVTADRFRRDLRRFASLATSGEQGDAAAQREELKAFMKRLRKGSEGGTGERDELLDRRRQVTITARAKWPETSGKPDSVYMQLGEKSGGEVQELIAFILGAALLFCLGNEMLEKPSFAPVMLDEGFIKADSKFTQRAIRAWSGFGFQVIIATPHGKVESLVDCMERYLTVTKDDSGRSYIAQAKTAEGLC